MVGQTGERDKIVLGVLGDKGYTGILIWFPGVHFFILLALEV